ncbi:MAG: hypothetical protein OXP69_19960 [Spirochaetaceae bacterium]|nr:hypothetical protein [Rhodospirillaceae bacterium]MDE0026692.1 hypothetical protein [Spirochaetaceae bacterium]
MTEHPTRRVSVNFSIDIQIGIKYDKEVHSWVSVCPALDLFSQGDTEAQASKNIHEAVGAFLGTCYELGTLNRVLKERGFQRGPEQSSDPHTIPIVRVDPSVPHAETAAASP